MDTSKQKMHPPSFSIRDKRNEFFRKRKSMKRNINNSFGSQEILLRENLTSFRKFLYIKAKKAKQTRFFWTSQRQILLRKNEHSSTVKVNNLDDFLKLGFRRSS